jgi:hypothetical protein
MRMETGGASGRALPARFCGNPVFVGTLNAEALDARP